MSGIEYARWRDLPGGIAAFAALPLLVAYVLVVSGIRKIWRLFAA